MGFELMTSVIRAVVGLCASEFLFTGQATDGSVCCLKMHKFLCQISENKIFIHFADSQQSTDYTT